MKMELARKMVGNLPPFISITLFGIKFFCDNPKKILSMCSRVRQYEKQDQSDWDKNDRKHLYKTLRTYCLFCSHIGAEDFLNTYFEKPKLKLIKSTNKESKESNDIPILICCVKNDLDRVKKVYEYHKSIGIDKFIFVDNDSEDGTREWLEEQDVDLYFTDEDYSAGKKSAWVQKVIDIYGYDRWYLVVDSDELFTYPGVENNNIQELIRYAEVKKLDRIESVLLDMYPEHELYANNETDFITEYRFFDQDSYYEAKDGRGYMKRGGPRKRAFGDQLDHSEPLSKYPLMYVKYGDLWSDHRPLPFSKNFNSECLAVLRHYKFMSGDYEKYIRISEEGRYYNGSANYKIYTQKGIDVSMKYEKSVEYIDSNSLACLDFIKTVDFDGLGENEA